MKIQKKGDAILPGFLNQRLDKVNVYLTGVHIYEQLLLARHASAGWQPERSLSYVR